MESDPARKLQGKEPDPGDTDALGLLIGDYIERLNAGEQVTPEEIRAAHPERAREILSQLRAFVEIDVGDDLGLGAVRNLGDYTLRRRIGRGGMGVVYEAWQGSLDRRVALKVLPPGLAADTKACARFVREAQVAAKLSHPSVVPVFGFGVESGTPYFAMDFVEGETLAQVVARMRTAAPDALTAFGAGREELAFYSNVARSFADVADGLQHAHSKGVVHRDIKPSNLILDAATGSTAGGGTGRGDGDGSGDGHGNGGGGGSGRGSGASRSDSAPNAEGAPPPRLRILDFGLARLEGQESLSASGDVVGTPLYMSPEQARRKKVPLDHRTDVYSLGATLYEVLTLEPPFRGKDHEDTLSQIIARDPRPPRQLNPRVPRDLETIVLKCLRKEPGDRYGTAEALGQDLRRFVRGDPIEARAQTRWELVGRKVWRRRKSLLLLAASIVALGTILALLRERGLEAERRAHALYEREIDRAVLLMGISQMSVRQIFASPLAWFNPSPGSLDDLEAEGFLGILDPLDDAGLELDRAVERCPAEPDAYYHRAGLSVLRDDAPRAREDLGRALQRDPRHLGARVLRAVLDAPASDAPPSDDLAQGDLSGGDPEVPAAVSPFPSGTIERDLFDAHVSLRANRWEDAARAFRSVEETMRVFRGEGYAGLSLEAKLGRATAAFESGNYLGALMAFSEVRALWPELAELDVVRAQTVFLSGAEDAAEALFREIHARSARKDPLAYEILLFYGRRGRAERALEWAGALSRPAVRERYRTFFLPTLGRASDAVEAGRAAVALAPESFYAHADLGAALDASHRPLEAMVHYREALRLGPESSYPHVAMAWGHYARGDLQGTVEELRAASRIAPEKQEILCDLGRYLTDLGEVEEAKRILEACVARDPGSVWALGNLARARIRERDYDGAIELYRRAQRTDPGNGWLHNQLGWGLRDMGRLEEAKEHLRQAIRLSPRNVQAFAYSNLAETHLRWEDRPAEAESVLREAIAEIPDWSRLRRLLGDACLAQERVLEALAAYRQAVDLDIGWEAGVARLRLAAVLRRPDLPPLGDEAGRIAKTVSRVLDQGEPLDGLPELLGAIIPRIAHDRSECERLLRRGLEELGDPLTDAVLEGVAALPESVAGVVDAYARLVSNGGARRNLDYLDARLLALGGKLPAAIDALQALLASDAGDPAPALCLAECLRAMGRATEAERVLRVARVEGTPYERDVLDLWAALRLADLGQDAAAVREALPWSSPGVATELRWLLERLVAGEPIRVDCGGKGLTDGATRAWAPDRFFLGGSPSGYSGGEIAGTYAPALYRSERAFSTARPGRPLYRVPLPRGTYRVTLHFAETLYRDPGLRRFHVRIEGVTLLEDFDPGRGGFARAVLEPREVEVSDGLLEIEFVPARSSATIAAIEIERMGGGLQRDP